MSSKSQNPVKDEKVVKNHVKDKLHIFQLSFNIIAHGLILVTVTTCLCFAFKSYPMNATQIHVAFCVIGYQLLMAQAILSLSNDNFWSSGLKLIHKRRIHWILQLLGSGLAIIGSFIKILDKEQHWNSIHGKFALTALVFTSVSLVNGLTSLYSYELRKRLSGNLSKITHVFFGSIAFVMACCCLCYGFQKRSFKAWASTEVIFGLIVMTAAFSTIIVINPAVSLFKKSTVYLKKVSTK